MSNREPIGKCTQTDTSTDYKGRPKLAAREPIEVTETKKRRFSVDCS